MNKDDYIHLFKEACGDKCNAEYNPCAFRQAANELAKLEPVAWGYKNSKGEIHDCMTRLGRQNARLHTKDLAAKLI